MKPSSHPPKTSSRLSDFACHQLNMYAMAATAAGVSALTLVPAAEGKVIYTKTNVDIFVRNGGFPLDLNHDKVTDFNFVGRSSTTCCSDFNSVKIAPAQLKNAIQDDQNYNAAALRAGVVDAKAPFDNAALLMGAYDFTYWRRQGQPQSKFYKGPWENSGKGVKNRYLLLQPAGSGDA
jgi:hypothetical protein